MPPELEADRAAPRYLPLVGPVHEDAGPAQLTLTQASPGQDLHRECEPWLELLRKDDGSSSRAIIQMNVHIDGF
jgi:hypothetical protein